MFRFQKRSMSVHLQIGLSLREHKNAKIMAGKTKDMSQIKQLLLLKKQGVSNRGIARSIGMNKETVNNYVRKALGDELGIDGLLGLDDPVLEVRLKGGNAAYTDERFEEFKSMLPYLQEEMRRKHVTLKLLWEEYIRDSPQGYSLTQFRHHYRQNAVAGRSSPSTVLSDTYVGGEKLYLDFAGDTLGYTDMETGEEVRVQTFVACLPASDYGYALCVPSQRTEDFVYAITECLKSLGGVPKIWVPDNLKAAVVRTDRYEPSLNRMMEDLANHYGAVVIPARPLHPKDKCLVENHVKVIYRRVYAELRNRRFYSLEELNRAVAEKMLHHNQKRMQTRPYSREERFLAVDRPNLLPLPPTDFEVRYYADLKVGQNCCVLLGRDKHYYSVPYVHIGKSAKVIYTRSVVKIYVDGELVATHRRDMRQGTYTLAREHLASNSLSYRDRSPGYYIEKGGQSLDELGRLISNIFYTSEMPAETHYRSCDALLSLQRKSDPVVFRQACQTALSVGRYSYGFVKSLVESRCAGVSERQAPPPPAHENIRGKSHFA